MPGMRLPSSSTIAEGTPMTKPPFPLVDCSLLNGVTSGAGETVFVEAAVHLGILRQRAREHADRVMAAIAVPRKLDAFGPQQNVDAGAIERRAEGIRVQRLPPLAVGFLVAASAIRGGQKGLRWNEVVAFDVGIARGRDACRCRSKNCRWRGFCRRTPASRLADPAAPRMCPEKPHTRRRERLARRDRTLSRTWGTPSVQ